MKKKVALLLSLVLVALCVARIAFVNATAIRFETRRHAVGETVELAGSFINEPLGSEDYSVTVLGMERMTHDEYIERYGIDKAAGLDGDGAKSVICVEMSVRNAAASDSEGSAIELIGMGLNLANGDAVLQIDNELWSKSEPSVPSGGLGALSIVPQTDYTTHIPYSAATGYVDSDNGELPAGAYELHLSSEPIRNLVVADVA